MNAEQIANQINAGCLDRLFAELYGARADGQRERYLNALKEFVSLYGDREELRFFSAPGRIEVGGNHTDHNHGCVLAAAVNIDTLAVAAKSDSDIIRLKSSGYKQDTVKLSELCPDAREFGDSTALVRGIAAGFSSRGLAVGGFDAYTVSDVSSGSGLSSSAAFESLVCAIMAGLYNNGAPSPVTRAIIAQSAENHFFGKPCGLMDQMASSVGGFLTIDFADPSDPGIETVDFDFGSSGYVMCVTNTGGSHADLTDRYAAIPNEMYAVAACFDAPALRDVPYQEFLSQIPNLRDKTGDRAILRAMHFYSENDRVSAQAAALKHGDFAGFLKLAAEAGRSSFMYNQNVCSDEREQGLALALALSDHLLDGAGASRVTGGGFAGAIMAFVPESSLASYLAGMENVFGKGSCMPLSVRRQGAIEAAGELYG